MGYQDFRPGFKEPRRQHNILALVGNGFDIQVLMNHESPTDTRYESFYHYLMYRKFNPENHLVRKMESLRASGKENWSDIESAISDLVAINGVASDVVVADLREMQVEFSGFLDSVATPELLGRIGERSVEHGLAMRSFAEFLADISEPGEYFKMRLPRLIDIGDVFNFRFVNFNYTPLLDDFVYLDQVQFDPHPFQYSDRNISFRPNMRGHEGARERADFRMLSYVVSDVIHPHGVQHVPRSLLFGVDTEPGVSDKLCKPYWAQNDVRYHDLFPETDLFIVFGCSLGETDGWWWRNIAKALAENDRSEMILYWWTEDASKVNNDHLRDKFGEVSKQAGLGVDLSGVLSEKMRVVVYDDNTERVWLNSNPKTIPRL